MKQREGEPEEGSRRERERERKRERERSVPIFTKSHYPLWRFVATSLHRIRNSRSFVEGWSTVVLALLIVSDF